MKVLIVGSTHDKVVESKREAFIQACRELGTALARAGVEAVVGSDSTNTADRYVLEGFAKVDGRHRAWILRPESGETPFAEQTALPVNRVEFIYKRLRGPWSAGRVPQIQAADAVLLIGGGPDTLTSGYVAAALERPVLAIASFGGAAAELWPHLEPYYNQLGGLGHRIGNLRENWQSDNADLAIQVIKELVKRRVFKSKPRLPLGIYLTLLVSCLGGWVVLFTNPLNHPVYSFFAMLAVAGLLGTILRNNLRLVFDPTATFSWNELFVEMGAGLLLGFALALLYLVGALTITGKTEAVLLPGSTGDFQRVAVVMTLLGLGGGLMIEQAADRVRQWFTDRLQAKDD
jgi:hypothetical protein